MRFFRGICDFFNSLTLKETLLTFLIILLSAIIMMIISGMIENFTILAKIGMVTAIFAWLLMSLKAEQECREKFGQDMNHYL